MPPFKFWLRTSAIPLALIILSYALFVRPWSMRWGATEADERLRLPGDSLIPAGATVSTCAVTVHAPASEVWPWLLQLGQGRGGFYSYEWLENLFAAKMHNAERIVPEYQKLKVGDSISYQQNGPAARVMLLEPERALVIGEGWTFALVPVDSATTRFIVRYPYDRIVNIPHALYYHSIFEPAHFVMEVGMMLGIKQRAERSFHARKLSQEKSTQKKLSQLESRRIINLELS